MYDLIGDLHGHAEPLRHLLAALGYRRRGGIWSHPTHKAVFVGDFIDRGPEQIETLRIARGMLAAGAAYAVMGNHEFNAVAWTLPHPDQPDGWLRAHSVRNRGHHQAFLEQVGEGSAAHAEWVAWFRTLPLYLDLPGIRVVHACWHTEALRRLAPWLDGEQRIRRRAWYHIARPGTGAYADAETVLKGIELTLPEPFAFVDGEGNRRRRVRTRWWEREARSYRDVAMVPRALREQLPDTPAPIAAQPGYDGAKPVFIGHYWLTGEPAPLTPRVACLDYSVAAKRGPTRPSGKLCAYRWYGEASLRGEHFHWVDAV
jgi:hypothetical protein